MSSTEDSAKTTQSSTPDIALIGGVSLSASVQRGIALHNNTGRSGATLLDVALNNVAAPSWANTAMVAVVVGIASTVIVVVCIVAAVIMATYARSGRARCCHDRCGHVCRGRVCRGGARRVCGRLGHTHCGYAHCHHERRDHVRRGPAPFVATVPVAAEVGVAVYFVAALL